MKRKQTSAVAEVHTQTYDWSVQSTPKRQVREAAAAYTVSLRARPVRRRAEGESIGLRAHDPAGLVKSLHRGLPASSFDRLQRNLDITANELAATVNIAPRTLARRRKEGRLQTDESERVLRIARLLDYAVDVMGDMDAARQWLTRPCRALGGATPLTFADTEPGALEVMDLLGRIEHGVFS